MRERDQETANIRGVVHSGVVALDDWLGGVQANGSHLLTGGSGSGKSAIALLFADAGLRRGESVAMLVHAHVDHLKTQARYLGVDLDAPLRDGRLLLLRYRSDFARRLAQAASVEQSVDNLARAISPREPTRLVIDTVAPFFSGTPPLAPVVGALMEMIERCGATTLLTFSEDLSAGYDRILEPLVHGSAAVIRLVREDADVRRADLVNLRYPPPSAPTLRFVIRERIGIVAEHVVKSEPRERNQRGDRLTLRVP